MAAYQTFVPDCDCKNKGILFKDNIACCRWCLKPWGHGGMINYNDESFKQPIHDTPEPEQTTKERFSWDDDLVQEFFSMLPRYFSQGHSTNSAMNKFKASKPSQSNTPKESVFDEIKLNNRLKQLNDATGSLVKAYELWTGEKLYTQSDLNKAIEDAFRAGKMFTWAQSNMGEPGMMKWIYETPQDYLKAINK